MPIPGGEITKSDIWVAPVEEIQPVVESVKEDVDQEQETK